MLSWQKSASIRRAPERAAAAAAACGSRLAHAKFGAEPVGNVVFGDHFMLRMTLALLAIACSLATAISRGQDSDELLREAAQAAQRGEHERAISRLSDVIKQNPKSAIAWYQRGREQFRAGHIAESIADFDKYVELEPDAARRLWERGISYYYAGEFEKGAKQFEEYQKFHDQDVENAVWRYLCVARSSNVEKARANLLSIISDPRVPMMQIYALYQGKLKPDDVLAAANDQPPNKELHNQRLFYTHLYIGLWYEAAGNAEEAKKHILEAEKHKIGHYMWDVAHIAKITFYGNVTYGNDGNKSVTETRRNDPKK